MALIVLAHSHQTDIATASAEVLTCQRQRPVLSIGKGTSPQGHSQALSGKFITSDLPTPTPQRRKQFIPTGSISYSEYVLGFLAYSISFRIII